MKLFGIPNKLTTLTKVTMEDLIYYVKIAPIMTVPCLQHYATSAAESGVSWFTTYTAYLLPSPTLPFTELSSENYSLAWVTWFPIVAEWTRINFVSAFVIQNSVSADLWQQD
jgi:hypothetical protein